jgi:GNAT superfamily N-acetyltransferase
VDGQLTLGDAGSEHVIARRDDGAEISLDPGRLDLDRIFRWLSVESYWAAGRTREVIERSVTGSMVFGVYRPARPGGPTEQVGLARAVTDSATFAWICDVYIDSDVRGLGLGTWLMREVATELMGRRRIPRMVLATRDAHGLYEKAGFADLAVPGRWMEIDSRPASVVHPAQRQRADARDGT